MHEVIDFIYLKGTIRFIAIGDGLYIGLCPVCGYRNSLIAEFRQGKFQCSRGCSEEDIYSKLHPRSSILPKNTTGAVLHFMHKEKEKEL